jgi:hypothetical protein
MIWWPHDEVERDLAERQKILAGFEPGPFDVTLSGLLKGGQVANIRRYLYERLAIDNASDIADRAIHIRPEVVLAGVSQRAAVGVKIALERAGGKVTIKDGAARTASGQRFLRACATRSGVLMEGGAWTVGHANDWSSITSSP